MTDMASPEPQVLDILSGVLDVPVEELRTRPALAAHHWDSLSSLEALGQLEQRFGIRLDLRDFGAVRTVDEMVALVAAPAGAGTASPAA